MKRLLDVVLDELELQQERLEEPAADTKPPAIMRRANEGIEDPGQGEPNPRAVAGHCEEDRLEVQLCWRRRRDAGAHNAALLLKAVPPTRGVAVGALDEQALPVTLDRPKQAVLQEVCSPLLRRQPVLLTDLLKQAVPAVVELQLPRAIDLGELTGALMI